MLELPELQEYGAAEEDDEDDEEEEEEEEEEEGDGDSYSDSKLQERTYATPQLWHVLQPLMVCTEEKESSQSSGSLHERRRSLPPPPPPLLLLPLLSTLLLPQLGELVLIRPDPGPRDPKSKDPTLANSPKIATLAACRNSLDMPRERRHLPRSCWRSSEGSLFSGMAEARLPLFFLLAPCPFVFFVALILLLLVMLSG